MTYSFAQMLLFLPSLNCSTAVMDNSHDMLHHQSVVGFDHGGGHSAWSTGDGRPSNAQHIRSFCNSVLIMIRPGSHYQFFVACIVLTA